MQIELQNAGKKYHKNWIFRNLNVQIDDGQIVALTGHNGSGKSTLLNTIGGFVTPTEGQILRDNSKEYDQTRFNIATPYLNIPEEFTLLEQLTFHAKFKKPLMSIEDMPSLCDLDKSKNKLIQEYSSGMKQRVKLILAFCFDGDLLLLDEPTVNLDETGSQWYLELLRTMRNERTTIIASNQPLEYPNASKIIQLND
ncbi:MAG: ABC transporter ATP-binding protein [Cyclobacteriaceae bacterium]